MLRNIIPSTGHIRTLSLSQLINCIGDGAYYVCITLYFTQHVGFTPAEFGLSLTIAWVIALIVGIPVGKLVDLVGARKMHLILAFGASIAIFSYIFIDDVWFFALAASLYTISQRGVAAARNAFVAAIIDRAKISEAKGYIQIAFNFGLSIGAAIGGIAILIDNEAAYLSVLGVNAISLIIAAIIVQYKMPEIKHSLHIKSAKNLTVIRDKPFILLTMINALLILHIPLFDVALPLWVLHHTEAPTWVVSCLFILNTISVVLFMKYFAKGVTDLTSAIKYVRFAGVFLFLSCLLFAFSGEVSFIWAILILLFAAIMQVIGEMYQLSGTWQISFGLAPDDKQGEYQSFFGSGFTMAEMLGPLLLTNLVVYQGIAGWISLGVLFLVASLVMAPAARWAEKAERPFEKQKMIEDKVINN